MTVKPKLTISSGDYTTPPAPKDQAIVMFFGLPGAGKTTLGLDGAPDPVAFHDVDRRGYHAAQKAMSNGKRLNYLALDYPANLSKMNDAQAKAAGQKIWDRHMRNYEIAIAESSKGNVRTIVVDTITALAIVLAISKDGRVDQKKDDFGKTKGFVKAELSKMIRMSRDGAANLILLAHAKPAPWEGGQPTGQYTYQGPDTIEADVDIAGHLRIAKRRSVKIKSAPKHEIEITKAGIDLEQMYAVYTEEDWEGMGPFVYTCVMNYPGTGPDDWT